jgi:hypothetical protein
MIASFENGKLIRTYKVGLRVPKSLLKEQYELVMALEILHHLHREMRYPGESKLFTGKVNHGSNETKQRYNSLLKKYSTLTSLQQVDMEIMRVRKSLKALHDKNPKFRSERFSRRDLPKFTDPAAPQPSEMSLTDYQHLARIGLKIVSKHLNDRVMREIDRIPHVKREFLKFAFEISLREGRNYTMRQLQQRFEIALANITGIHSNIGRMAFYQLGMALKGYFDLQDKVEFLMSLLDPEGNAHPDFSGVIPILLCYYSPPNHLRNYLARAWNVEREWIRNTLVGWRRKMDKYLPVEYQVEPLTKIFFEMAGAIKTHARNEEDVRLISRLQKIHVLHLLPSKNVDLRPLLPSSLHDNYTYLQQAVIQESILDGLNPHLHVLTIQEVLEGLKELIGQVSEVQATFPARSSSHGNCQGFLNKLEFIKGKLITSSSELQELFNNFIIGNRFTSSIARFLSHGSRYRKLFTALRGIFALTLARKQSSAIDQFLSAFSPDSCLTFPFCSTRRKKTHLPVNLIFNKYIIQKKAHPSSEEYLTNKSDPMKPNVTDLFKEGNAIWLGLPIYSPSQEAEFQKVLEGTKLSTFRKGLLWFQVLPSKKIIESLARGAQVRDIRLNIPSGPTKKITMDIVLSASERSAFQHKGKFLEVWDENQESLRIPTHEIIGVDFNRIGPHMVSTANPDQEHDLSTMMKSYQDIHKKLKKIRNWELPHVQAQLDRGIDKKGILLTDKKRGRLESQLSLLHRRSERIMKEAKRQSLMIYLYLGWKSQASYFGWDKITGISTRNKNGALAQAITYLPKEKRLFTEFKQWVGDLKQQGFLPSYIDTIPVHPFTSQVCAECFQTTGEQARSRKKGICYHEFTCEICGRSTQENPVIHRHSNSARINALLVQQQVYSCGCTTS